jgi:hypothetical protein
MPVASLPEYGERRLSVELPTGTVAFLFTQIQGSTRSWAYYLKGDFELARRYGLEGLAEFEAIDHS